MIPDALSDWLQKLHPRTRKIGKNILESAVYRAISMAASFITVPILLHWLGQAEYGVWLTMQAVIGWFLIFDLGLGNGLRNKLAEALAANKPQLARRYVSSAYVIITGISLAMLVIYGIAQWFIDWKVVFNAPTINDSELRRTMNLVFLFFCVQFVFQLIKMIWLADQRPALTTLVNALGTLISLVAVFLASKLLPANLEIVAWIIGGGNLLLLVIANFTGFRGKYNAFRPSVKLASWDEMRKLTNLGLRFFILQGAALIVFATDNMIITQMIGPEEVPAYQIAFKYFNLVMVFFTLITVPYWSAYTEAFQKKDHAWIRSTVRSLMRIWVASLVVVMIMFVSAPVVYRLWVGPELQIPTMLSAVFAMWVALSAGLAIYGNFLSGVGKIQLSVYHAIFVSIINIPLSILLAGPLGLGSTGVILASVIGLIPRAIFQPIQYHLIIKGKARGIWNR